jgi:hypothetical protein
MNEGFASVRICTSHDAKLYKELPVQNAVELKFSPFGTFLSTWERPGGLSQAAFVAYWMSSDVNSPRSENGGWHTEQEPASLVRFHRRRGCVLHPEVTRRMVGRLLLIYTCDMVSQATPRLNN